VWYYYIGGAKPVVAWHTLINSQREQVRVHARKCTGWPCDSSYGFPAHVSELSDGVFLSLMQLDVCVRVPKESSSSSVEYAFPLGPLSRPANYRSEPFLILSNPHVSRATELVNQITTACDLTDGITSESTGSHCTAAAPHRRSRFILPG
jgi:hypothetical protein